MSSAAASEDNSAAASDAAPPPPIMIPIHARPRISIRYPTQPDDDLPVQRMYLPISGDTSELKLLILNSGKAFGAVPETLKADNFALSVDGAYVSITCAELKSWPSGTVFTFELPIVSQSNRSLQPVRVSYRYRTVPVPVTIAGQPLPLPRFRSPAPAPPAPQPLPHRSVGRSDGQSRRSEQSTHAFLSAHPLIRSSSLFCLSCHPVLCAL